MNNPRDSSDQSPQEGGEGGEGSNPPTESTRPSHASARSTADAARQEVESPRRSLPLGGTGGGIAEGDNVNPQAEGGGDGSVAAGPSRRTPVKKRSREGDAGAGSSSKRPAENDPPRGPYQCSVCPRVFDRDKGLFGHMRSHPNRNWRGAYPPPVFSREEIDEDLARVMERVSGQAKGNVAGNVADEEAARENEAAPTLDLNETPEAEEQDEIPRPDGKEFDLNKTPPRESDGDMQ